MHISATKFEEHFSNISGDILESTIYDILAFFICIIQNREYPQNENKIFQKEKREQLFLGCMWRHHFLKYKTKEPPKLLSSSGMRGGTINRHILNFRIIVVYDIKLWTYLSKNIIYLGIFSLLKGLKY